MENTPWMAASITPPTMARTTPPQGLPLYTAPAAARKAANSIMPSRPTFITPARCATVSPRAANAMEILSRMPAATRPTMISSISGPAFALGQRFKTQEAENHDSLDDVHNGKGDARLALQYARPDVEHGEQQSSQRHPGR